ncbi:MAG: hypothetical protein HYY04_11775, partial [Chloroflexi bacterium]|nr:hypothetical protein [Chloroflexota bacterium]
MRHRLVPDLAVCLALLLAAALFYADVLLTDAVLLPADNLFRAEPWRHAAGALVPHNDLIGDQVYQNLPWKTFARDEIRAGRIPLWNPYLFAGMPFLAAGQYGALYPLGAVFYLLPVPVAYEWFATLHLALAAIGMFAMLRTLGAGRFGAASGGLAYGFSGFLVVSMIWPQVVGAAVWLPWLILLGELLVRRADSALVSAPPPVGDAGQSANPKPSKSAGPTPPIPPVGGAATGGRPYEGEPAPATGRPASLKGGVPPAPPLVAALGVLIGTQFLAGHLEISFFVVFALTWYVLWRLVSILAGHRPQALLLPTVSDGARHDAAGAAAPLPPTVGFRGGQFPVWRPSPPARVPPSPPARVPPSPP